MDRNFRFPGVLLTRPSALLPLAMSLAALAIVLGRLLYGAMFHLPLVREADEGALAHLWQLFMAGQLPFVMFFAVKWLPRLPRQVAGVLALQLGAALAAMAPVYFLHL